MEKNEENFLVTLIIFVLLPNIGISAKGRYKNLTEEDVENLHAFYTKYGIDRVTEKEILNKLDSGIMLDSINPEKQGEEVLLKEVITVESVEVVYQYKDGSIRIEGRPNAEATDGMLSTRSIGSGNVINMGDRYYCQSMKITHDDEYVHLEYYASYYLYKNDPSSYIISYSESTGNYARVSYYTLGDGEFETGGLNLHQDGDMPGTLLYIFNVTNTLESQDYSYHLFLKVKNLEDWTEFRKY